MRYLMSIIFVLAMAMPVFANPSFCPMTGPRNCAVQAEEELVDLTKATIHRDEARMHKSAPTNAKAQLPQNGVRQHAQLQHTTVTSYLR